MTPLDPSAAVRERARPLSPDERRGAILDAVLPLIRERGGDVTSRELAEAACVAEGTVFRAFGDKDSLLQAALGRLLAPERFTAELRAVAHELPLEHKLTALIELLRHRFREVFEIMTVFQLQRPPVRTDADEWVDIVHELLAPELEQLSVPVEAVASYLRLVAFGSSVEPLNAAHPFDAAELATLITRGIVVA